MIERETAIKSVSNRRIETPEMELRRALDYQIGDVVQLKAGGKYAGRLGVVIGIRAIEYKENNAGDLAYTIKLSDEKSIEVCARRMKFIRHGDEKATAPEEG